MDLSSSRVRAGFALPDLLGLLVALAVAASLALAATRQMRQESMTASSLSQLRWIAGATSSYAADNGDQYWNFSWTQATTPPTYPVPSSDYIAQTYQAVDILRRRGRPDMPIIFAWFPYPKYSHLPLIDYLDRNIPDFNFVSPADKHLTAWARDPAAFDAGAFLPLQPDPTDVNKRWPYSSSFEQPTAFYDQSEPAGRIYQSGQHSAYLIPGSVVLGAMRIADVTYPSQKAHIYDTEQRELGGERLYFLDQDKNARVPILMADGSVHMRSARDANPGWRANDPTSFTATALSYSPRPWEPHGTTASGFIGRYRWTRGGIECRDFGGPEVDTGQP